MAAGNAVSADLAQDFLLSLSRGLQLAQLYEPGSPQLRGPVEALVLLLERLLAGGEAFAFERRDGAVTVNGAPLAGEGEAHAARQNLLEMLARRGVGGMSFRAPLDEMDWWGLLFEIARCNRMSETPFADLVDALAQRGLGKVALLPAAGGTARARKPGLRVEPRIFAVRTAAKATVLLEKYVESLGSPQRRVYYELKLHRILQDLVTVCAEGAWKYIGVVNNKPGRAYLYEHSVNVAVIALAVAARIGLGRRGLEELGIAALLHDVGKALLPGRLIHKEGRFTEEERQELKHSPARGVRALLSEATCNEELLHRILVVCEHQDADVKARHPYSEIVRLAERLDALMSPRPYRTALLPDEAVRRVTACSEFDAVFRRALLWTLGLYPPGTFLELSTGEVAVSYQPQADPALCRRPVVRRVRDKEGRESAKAPVVDLATSPEQIVRCIPASELGSGAPRFLAKPVPAEPGAATE